MLLSPFEWTIAKRYMLPGRSEAVITLVALAIVLGPLAALPLITAAIVSFLPQEQHA